MKDEIRLKHALMEYDHEIAFCKECLAKGMKGDDLKYTQMRLKEAEEGKKRLLAESK